MHMADALLSPIVGGTMWAASAGTIAYCSKKVREELDDRKVPLMGVLGAFIFAAQMINFTIPATGSSGHLGGGLILAILLGPYAAFLTIASVLVVQALFFADGGLLALGCNIFNLGFFPAFIAYPLLYKQIVGDQPTPVKIAVGAVIAAVVGLQLGALCVVLQTTFSGISSLPFTAFVTMMQPIHLAIGIVEGVVTTVVVTAVATTRPEVLQYAKHAGIWSARNLAFGFLAVTLLIGGVVSRLASEQPDGLEWSIEKLTGKADVAVPDAGVHGSLAALQSEMALLPDYNFKRVKTVDKKEAKPAEPAAGYAVAAGAPEEKKGEGSKIGTSVAGLVGGVITLAVAAAIGLLLRRKPSA